MKDNIHTPVLLKETIEGLHIETGKRYVDATVGAGGHTAEIVRGGGILLGIDADGEAIGFAKQRLTTDFPQKKEGTDWTIIQGNFGYIEELSKEKGFNAVDGILLDLGVSSYQIDTPKRGFSYRFLEEPLDLRFDQSKGETAAQLIQKLSEEDLYDIFAGYGEEQLARPIATAFIIARRLKPIMTTGDVVDIVKKVSVHSPNQSATLSRIFQALRVYVNSELDMLRMGLNGSKNLLVPGGRLAVISFQSLEDRMVKQFMNGPQWHVLTQKPLIPTYVEIRQNKRSRSAKLRISERI
jgi:16S rRNA (cytosine1402-N4)-methyltransferase